MNDLFPRHPCVLARKSNSFRCRSLMEVGDSRCAVCREAMRDEVWRALREGDRSLAEFILADDLLTDAGFVVQENTGAVSSDPVLVLVRSETRFLTDSGDCAIEPEAEGGYSIYLTAGEDLEKCLACEDLSQAWVLLGRIDGFRPVR